MYDKDTAIKQMNRMGTSKTPFLFMIDFTMENCFLSEVSKIDPAELLFSFQGTRNFIQPDHYPGSTHFTKYPESYADYLWKFNKVMHHIQSGNTYLLNLTCQTRIHTNLSMKDIFLYGRAKYKLWYNDLFTFFSPEPFVQIKGNTIYSYPMKGTIDATVENAESIILNDPKELAEHYTIVDLIRNDLSMIATDVKVEKFRYVEELYTNQKNLLQVSSIISGKLPEDYHLKLGDIIFTLLPAGSVTGAPKKKTVEIIEAVERYNRGFYTGIAGFYDGNSLDSCVIIRFIEDIYSDLYFKSGGGVTSFSDPQKEYEEMIQKIYVPFH
jgi:para-aminobenzoate synthetase component I